jgi:uncharacterized protein (TIGR00251 family)
MAGLIPVRVTPRSSKPGIGKWREGADGREELEVQVRAAPADGAANEEVRRVLAKALDLAPSEVTIVAGQTSRHKRFAVPIDLDEVKRRLG